MSSSGQIPAAVECDGELGGSAGSASSHADERQRWRGELAPRGKRPLFFIFRFLPKSFYLNLPFKTFPL